MDHGKVHNIALMGTEEAQRSEEAFYIPEGHPGFHDYRGEKKVVVISAVDAVIYIISIENHHNLSV